MWIDWMHVWLDILFFIGWGEEISYRGSRVILVNDKLETMAQLGWHSATFDL